MAAPGPEINIQSHLQAKKKGEILGRQKSQEERRKGGGHRDNQENRLKIGLLCVGFGLEFQYRPDWNAVASSCNWVNGYPQNVWFHTFYVAHL